MLEKAAEQEASHAGKSRAARFSSPGLECKAKPLWTRVQGKTAMDSCARQNRAYLAAQQVNASRLRSLLTTSNLTPITTIKHHQKPKFTSPTWPPRKSNASRRRLPTVHARPASIGVRSSFRSLPATGECAGKERRAAVRQQVSCCWPDG